MQPWSSHGRKLFETSTVGTGRSRPANTWPMGSNGHGSRNVVIYCFFIYYEIYVICVNMIGLICQFSWAFLDIPGILVTGHYSFLSALSASGFLRHFLEKPYKILPGSVSAGLPRNLAPASTALGMDSGWRTCKNWTSTPLESLKFQQNLTRNSISSWTTGWRHACSVAS